MVYNKDFGKLQSLNSKKLLIKKTKKLDNKMTYIAGDVTILYWCWTSL